MARSWIAIVAVAAIAPAAVVCAGETKVRGCSTKSLIAEGRLLEQDQ